MSTNTGTGKAYYFFKAELPEHFDLTKAKRIPAGQRWELACYNIEKSVGMHTKMKQQKANQNLCCIRGYHYHDFVEAGRRLTGLEPVDPEHVLKDGDRLVLCRCALPPNTQPSLPREILQQDKDLKDAERVCRWQDLTEEERLGELLRSDQKEDAFLRYQPRDRDRKDRDRACRAPLKTGPPPPHYVCHRCLKTGHYKHQCPTLADSSFIPMDRRRRTTGVPRSQLRPARAGEEGWAWLHSDGRLMVPLF